MFRWLKTRNILKVNRFKSVETSETSLQKVVIFLTVMSRKLRAGKTVKKKNFVSYWAAFKLGYTISDKEILKNVKNILYNILYFWLLSASKL